MTILNKENSSELLGFLSKQSNKYLLRERAECLEGIKRYEAEGDKNHKGEPCLKILFGRSERIVEISAKVELIDKVLQDRKLHPID
jgi:hypothetical protein